MFRTSIIVVLLSSILGTANAGRPTIDNPALPILPPEEQPLIVKSNGSGFVSADWNRSETCEIYSNRVVITRNFGLDNAIVETRAIELVGDIAAVIVKAAAEPLTETDNFLCDGPSSFIFAGAPGSEVTLFSTGGCGSPEQVRNGGASQILTDMVLTYCPKLHDSAFDFSNE
jgi:hypothetical protein